MVAAGALQLALVDTQGATPRTLLLGVAGCVAALFAGGIAGDLPLVPAVLLVLLLAFLLRMLPIYGEVAGNLGFIILLTYASAQSVPQPRELGLEHLGWFSLGALWGVVLTLLLWGFRRALGDGTAWNGSVAGEKGGLEDGGDAPPPARQGSSGRSPWRIFTGSLTFRSEAFRHALRTACAAAIATAIGGYFRPAHSFWLILTVLVVLKPNYMFTRQRTLERMIGSVVGGLAAMLLVAHVHDVVVLDLLLGVFGVLAFSHLPGNYGLYVIFLTPFIVLLSGIAVPTDTGVAIARISQTLIGGALGFAVAALARRPSRLPVALGRRRSLRAG